MKLFSTATAIAYCLVTITPATAIDFGRFCDGLNLSGACTTFRANKITDCVNLTGANAFWNDKISSIRVNAPFFCQFYVNTGCKNTENKLGVNNGAIRNLNLNGFNNRISSFLCAGGV